MAVYRYTPGLLLGVLFLGVGILLAIIPSPTSAQLGPVPTLFGEDNGDVDEGAQDPPTYEEEGMSGNQNSTGTTPPCVNLSPDCEDWAKLGECWNNPSYMVKYCSAACWSCPQVHACADVDEGRCPTWAAFDQCKNNTEWMRKNCFKSCGLCRQANLTGEEMHVPSNPGNVQATPPSRTPRSPMAGKGRPTVEPPAPISTSPVYMDSTTNAAATISKDSSTVGQSMGKSTSGTDMSMSTVTSVPGTTVPPSSLGTGAQTDPPGPVTDGMFPITQSPPPSMAPSVVQTSESPSSPPSTPSVKVPSSSLSPSSTQMTSSSEPTKDLDLKTAATTTTAATRSSGMIVEASTTIPISLEPVTEKSDAPTSTPRQTTKMDEIVSEEPGTPSKPTATTSKTTIYSTVPTPTTTPLIIYDEFSSSTASPPTTVTTQPPPPTTTTSTRSSASSSQASSSSTAQVIADMSSTTTGATPRMTGPPSSPTPRTMSSSTMDVLSSSPSTPSAAATTATTTTTKDTTTTTTKEATETPSGMPSSTASVMASTRSSNPVSSTQKMTTAAQVEMSSPKSMSTSKASATMRTPTLTTTEKELTCFNNFESDEDCTYWTLIGECMANYDWMRENCGLACGFCSNYAVCMDDLSDDTSCVTWAEQGECSANLDWMKENCFRSCGYCDELEPDLQPSTPGVVFPTVPDIEDTGPAVKSTSPSSLITGSIASRVIHSSPTVVASTESRAEHMTHDIEAGQNNKDMTTTYLNSQTTEMQVGEDGITMRPTLEHIDPSQITEEILNPDTTTIITTTYTDANSNESICFNRWPFDYDCDQWARMGECTASYEWMSYNCTKSCDLCDLESSSTEEPKVSSDDQGNTDSSRQVDQNRQTTIESRHVTDAREQVTSDDPSYLFVSKTTAIPVVTDDDSVHTTLKTVEGHALTTANTVYEYNTEGSESSVPTEITTKSPNIFPIEPTCFNRWPSDRDCVTWANRGECIWNKSWMHHNCSKACGHCEDIVQRAYPPIDFNTDSTVSPDSIDTDGRETEPSNARITTETSPEHGDQNLQTSESSTSIPAIMTEVTADLFGNAMDSTTQAQPATEVDDRFSTTMAGPEYETNQDNTSSTSISGTAHSITTESDRSSPIASHPSTVSLCSNTWASDEDCEQWVLINECDENAEWMSANCARSCGVCKQPTPTTQATKDMPITTSPSSDVKYTESQLCFNLWESDVDCENWAAMKECTLNQEWMKINCLKSCGYCPHGATLETTTSTTNEKTDSKSLETMQSTTSGPTTSAESYINLSTLGSTIKLLTTKTLSTLGNNYTFKSTSEPPASSTVGMDLKSTETSPTKITSVRTAVPSSDESLGKLCRNKWDSDVDCVAWTEIGECDLNFDWMRDNCEKACGYCITTIETSTSLTTDNIGPSHAVTNTVTIDSKIITDAENLTTTSAYTYVPEDSTNMIQPTKSVNTSPEISMTTNTTPKIAHDITTDAKSISTMASLTTSVSQSFDNGNHSSYMTSTATVPNATEFNNGYTVSTKQMSNNSVENNPTTGAVTNAFSQLTAFPKNASDSPTLTTYLPNARTKPNQPMESSTAQPSTKSVSTTPVDADIITTVKDISTTIPSSTLSPIPGKPTATTLMPPTTKKPMSDLYVSNETHILVYDGSSSRVIISQPRGSIVGLAVDVKRQLLFWSDMGWFTRGIYRSTLSGQNITRILKEDILEVNGITLDYSAGHIYWTDAQKRRIDVADYDGKNRRVLISGDLQIPRGIVADPLHGYLFWGDQGTRKIERSLLDGTQRTTLVSEGLIWPNQLAFDFNKNNLLYIDGWNKMLSSIKVDGGSGPQKIADLSNFTESPMFGLALGEGFGYVSAWGKGTILKVSLSKESEPVEVLSGLTKDCLFSLASTDGRGQPESLNPCSWNDKGGCSHLCLPTGVFTYRCSCPSLGGLVVKEKQCVAPEAVLLYADAATGEVSFIDPGAVVREDYIVGKSSRPVAVGFDPKEKRVYWSDVKERSIHRAYLNGSGHEVILNATNGLGFVDGLVIDATHRKMYFTNMDFVSIDGTAYTWHRIEVIGLDGKGRRTIITDVEQPRGLWLDLTNTYLYYTDWGQNARLMRSNLDGSEQVVVRDGLENPNGIVILQDDIFLIDSQAKGREAGREGARGGLYKWNRRQETWEKLSITLHTPYGISSNGADTLYITDWGLQRLWSYDITSGDMFPLLLNAKELMGVHYAVVPMEYISPSDVCEDAGCSGLCFEKGLMGNTECYCSSYDALVTGPSGQDCSKPESFVLIADLNEIRMISLVPMDSQMNTLITGNRYASSFSALVWDTKRSKFYFSDVNRRKIFKSDLSGSYTLLYDAGDVVDGMAIVDDDYLFWTAQEEGAIYRLNLDLPDSNATAIVTSLNEPKSLVANAGDIFWTEVGLNGSVNMARSDGSQIVQLWSSMQMPEALFLNADQTLVGFSTNEENSIYTCSATEGNCSLVSALSQKTGVASHILDVGEYLYYSDWNLGSIVRVDLLGFTRATEIYTGLMRPTSFQIVTGMRDNDFCYGNLCSDLCIPLPLDYACACRAGRGLLPDGLNCYEMPPPSIASPTTTLSSSTPTSQTLSSTSSSTMSTPMMGSTKPVYESSSSSSTGTSLPSTVIRTQTIPTQISTSTVEAMNTTIITSTQVAQPSTEPIVPSTPLTKGTSEMTPSTTTIPSSTVSSTSTTESMVPSTSTTTPSTTATSTTTSPTTKITTTSSTLSTSTQSTPTTTTTMMPTSSATTRSTTTTITTSTMSPSPSTVSSTPSSPSTVSSTPSSPSTVSSTPSTTTTTTTERTTTTTERTTTESTTRSTTTMATTTVPLTSASTLTIPSSSAIFPTDLPSPSTKLSTKSSTESATLSTPETSSMSLNKTTPSFSTPLALSNETLAFNVSTASPSLSTKSLPSKTTQHMTIGTTRSSRLPSKSTFSTDGTTTPTPLTPQITDIDFIEDTTLTQTKSSSSISHTQMTSTVPVSTIQPLSFSSTPLVAKTKPPTVTPPVTDRPTSPIKPTTHIPSTQPIAIISTTTTSETKSTSSLPTKPPTSSKTTSIRSTSSPTPTIKSTSSTDITPKPITTKSTTNTSTATLSSTTTIPSTISIQNSTTNIPTTTVPTLSTTSTTPSTTTTTESTTNTPTTRVPIPSTTTTTPSTTTITKSTTNTPTITVPTASTTPTPPSTTRTTKSTTINPTTTVPIPSTTITTPSTTTTITTSTTNTPTTTVPIPSTTTTTPSTTTTTSTTNTPTTTVPIPSTTTTTQSTTTITKSTTNTPTTTVPIPSTTPTPPSTSITTKSTTNTPTTTVPIPSTTTTTPSTTTTTKSTENIPTTEPTTISISTTSTTTTIKSTSNTPSTKLSTTLPTTRPSTTILPTTTTSTPSTPSTPSSTITTITTTPTTLSTTPSTKTTKLTTMVQTTTSPTTMSVQPTTARRTPMPATGPSFVACPSNRTVSVELGTTEDVVVWWSPPYAIDAEGNIIETIEVNKQPGSKFRKGPTLIEYSTVDNRGKRAKCVFFIFVIEKKFTCVDTPAPLNGEMDCKVEEFVYTCQMKCMPGFAPNADLLSVKHYCRTTGWQPEYPANYSSQSCMKVTPLQKMMPVTITYSGTCQDKLTPQFEEAFVTKLSWRFKQLGLCPESEGEVGFGLCQRTNYDLTCDRSLGRKKRQVERVKVNVTIGVPESTAGSTDTGQVLQMRNNIEQLVLSDQINIDIGGEQYRAQQVGYAVPEVIGCPPGHTRLQDVCLLCPAGSYVDGESGRCVACSSGYYQSKPGKDMCEKCPDDTVTGDGAISRRQCAKKVVAPGPTEASLTSTDTLSIPIIVGLSVAAGIVFFIALTLFICTLRKMLKSKGKMKLDQEKAMANGNHVRYSNPAFVARPAEETADSKDPTPRYLAVTKVPANGDGASVHVVPQPAQYRRLPSGQVVRVVPVNTNSKVRMPPVKSRKYDMKNTSHQVVQVPVAQPTQTQGMYRKYQPGQPTGWGSLSAAEKLTQ